MFGPLAGAKVTMCQHLLRLLSVFEYGANGETVDTREASRPEVRIL